MRWEEKKKKKDGAVNKTTSLHKLFPMKCLLVSLTPQHFLGYLNALEFFAAIFR